MTFCVTKVATNHVKGQGDHCTMSWLCVSSLCFGSSSSCPPHSWHLYSQTVLYLLASSTFTDSTCLPAVRIRRVSSWSRLPPYGASPLLFSVIFSEQWVPVRCTPLSLHQVSSHCAPVPLPSVSTYLPHPCSCVSISPAPQMVRNTTNVMKHNK